MPGTAAAHNHPDAYDTAMTDEPSRFAGQIKVDAWTCVLVKGQGKVAYDPTLHQGQRTSTAIEITIAPLDATRPLIQREMLNWTRDFRGVVRPSLETLAAEIGRIRGVQGTLNPLREINDLWVIGEYVPRPDNKPGETWTTLKLTSVYETKEECQDAFDEASDLPPMPPEEPTVVAPDPQRVALAAFLPTLWTQAGGDKAEFSKLLAANPMLSVFNMDSPEVVALFNE